MKCQELITLKIYIFDPKVKMHILRVMSSWKSQKCKWDTLYYLIVNTVQWTVNIRYVFLNSKNYRNFKDISRNHTKCHYRYFYLFTLIDSFMDIQKNDLNRNNIITINKPHHPPAHWFQQLSHEKVYYVCVFLLEYF